MTDDANGHQSDTDTVWVVTSIHSRQIYHTSEACANLKRADDYIEVGRDDIGDHQSPCQSPHCEGDEHDRTSTVTCPYCGTDVPQFPTHLPCDETPDPEVEP